MNLRQIKEFAAQADIHNLDTVELNISSENAPLCAIRYVEVNVPKSIYPYIKLKNLLPNQTDINTINSILTTIHLLEEEFKANSFKHEQLFTFTDEVLITNKLLEYIDGNRVRLIDSFYGVKINPIRINSLFKNDLHSYTEKLLGIIKREGDFLWYDNNVFIMLKATKSQSRTHWSDLVWVSEFIV